MDILSVLHKWFDISPSWSLEHRIIEEEKCVDFILTKKDTVKTTSAGVKNVVIKISGKCMYDLPIVGLPDMLSDVVASLTVVYSHHLSCDIKTIIPDLSIRLDNLKTSYWLLYKDHRCDADKVANKLTKMFDEVCDFFGNDKDNTKVKD